ncbi:helix-turn-helix domain-containing protein [Myroides odoratimimus]|uniref:helix-turn-helix domain-containing protein n=1 Tax=Myroides odoratimimus TaxID=76832 RepID=UPI003101A0B2
MLINILFFISLGILFIKELILYYIVKKKNVYMVSFNLLSRLNYLVIIQISSFFWFFVVKKDPHMLPLWILLFVFYGPYLFLILYHYLLEEKNSFLNYYLQNSFFSLCFFVFLSFVFFHFIDDLHLSSDIWYFLCVFVSLHLLYYAIKGFYMLGSIKINREKYFQTYKVLMILLVFISIFSVFFAITLVFYRYYYNVLFSFLGLNLFGFYAFLGTLRYKLIYNIYNNTDVEVKGQFDIVQEKNQVLISFQFSDPIVLDTDNQKNIDLKVIESEEDVYQEDTKYEKVRLSKDVLNRIDKKVNQIVLINKAYLDPNFKITDLAIQTKISRYYLAQYFSSIHNMNFREYINSLRIDDILEYIKNQKQKEKITVNELFFQSAFNSKASFFKCFKSITGMTPSEYLKSL